jgi:hypothetical protein
MKASLFLTFLISQAALAGPVCDSLSIVNSQVLTCQRQLSQLQDENYNLNQKIQSMYNDLNSGRIARDLRSCSQTVASLKSSTDGVPQEIDRLKNQTTGVLNQLHVEKRALDAITSSFQCAGMDKKNAVTYMVDGRDENEARRNLDNPPTAGLDAVGLQKRQAFLDMKRKHGVFIYCFRAFQDGDRPPVVDIGPVPGVGGPGGGRPGSGSGGHPGGHDDGDGNSDVIPGIGPA